MSTTINKEEIQKFSKLAKEGGMLMENLNHFICLILLELST